MGKFVIARLFIEPSFVEVFKREMEELSVRTKLEPACIDYNCYTDPGGLAGNFTVIEQYRDEAGVKHHFASSYLAGFIQKIEEWKARDTQIHYLSEEPGLPF